MASLTIAIATTTVVLFLFPATRLFSAIGTMILALLYPRVFACLAALAVAGFAYYRWRQTSRG